MPKQLHLEDAKAPAVSPIGHGVDFYLHNGDRSSDIGDLGPSLTRQEFAAECDINEIMERYQRTGVIDHTSNREPFYFTFDGEVPDLMTAMQVRIDAERAFMTLPARVRKEFDNDPVKFVEFASDPENLDKMREWELAPPAPRPEPKAQDAANDDVPAPPKGKGKVTPPRAPEPDLEA